MLRFVIAAVFAAVCSISYAQSLPTPNFGGLKINGTTETFPASGLIVGTTDTQTLTNKSLTSPTMTGTPTVPTASVGTNTTQAASTAFVLANGGTGSAAAYATVAALTAATVPSGVQTITTAGYYAAGDGGGAIYVRKASAPSQPCYQQSADGAYWDVPDRSNISVKMCGAKGDGSTADDTAISNSIAALPSAGGTVYFPTGTYECATTCINLLNKTGINFLGAGFGQGVPAVTINSTATSGPLVRIDGDNGTHFTNIGFSYSSASFSGYLVDLRQVSGAQNTNWTTFTNFAAAGTGASSKNGVMFNLSDSINTYFDHGWMNNGYAGVVGAQTGHFTNGVYINNVWFNGANLSNPVVVGGANWTITNSTFEPSAATAASAIYLTSFGVTGLKISGNQFDDAGSSGTWINFEGSAGYGTPGVVYGLSVIANEFEGGAFALDVLNAVGGIIAGNHLDITSSTTGAIYQLSTTKGFVVIGNAMGTSGGPGVGNVYNGNPGVNSITDNNLGSGLQIMLQASTASTLPTCNSTYQGRLMAVTDANSATFNAAVAGGGSNHVMAYCNGTGWTVH